MHKTINRVSAVFISTIALLAACSDASREELPVQDTVGSEQDMSAQQSPDASVVLSDVIEIMGTDGIRSITYTGNAWRVRNSFRQTLRASPPWPFRDFITDYARTIDLDSDVSLATGDTYAQNLFFDPATPGSYIQNSGAAQANWRQQLDYWLSPWGFLEGAQENSLTAESLTHHGQTFTILEWQPGSPLAPSGLVYTVRAWINADNVISRTETWVEDDFMGDMHVVAMYDDYKMMDGVMVPGLIEIQQGGGGIFGIAVFDATVNPDNLQQLITPPETAGGGFFGGAGQAPEELFQQIDEGVYLVVGGYVALVAEFDDYLAVFEAGQSRSRGEQIIEQIKANLPGKPIRYIINSHPHSDHTAGLVPFIQEGATLITHQNNVDFMQMALTTPRTLLGEETLDLAIEGTGSEYVLEDDGMRLELHHVPNGHTDGMLVALLPEQGILFQADFTLPQPGAEANSFVVELAQLVARKNLQFERYLAVHAAQEAQSRDDLMAAIAE